MLALIDLRLYRYNIYRNDASLVHFLGFSNTAASSRVLICWNSSSVGYVCAPTRPVRRGNNLSNNMHPPVCVYFSYSGLGIRFIMSAYFQDLLQCLALEWRCDTDVDKPRSYLDLGMWSWWEPMIFICSNQLQINIL